MHRIEAGLLIPGQGDPVRDGVVILDGPRIGYAGPAAAAPPADSRRAGVAGGDGHARAVGLPRAFPRDQDL